VSPSLFQVCELTIRIIFEIFPYFGLIRLNGYFGEGIRNITIYDEWLLPSVLLDLDSQVSRW
jgi:hypothetical protein